MKKNILLILIVTFFSAKGQNLTIEQTLKYINNEMSLNNPRKNPCNFKLNSDGFLIYERYQKGIVSDFQRIQINDIGDLIIDSLGSELYIFVKCSNNENCCYFKYLDSRSAMSQSNNFLGIQITDSYSGKKIVSALKYLIFEGKRKGYGKSSDPFENSQQASGINGVSSKIKLNTLNNVYTLNLKVSNINGLFILDSGASDVVITKEFEQKLIQGKKINRSSYIQSGLYQIADGSIIECRRLIIPEIQIGNLIIKNVLASVTNGQDMLLGKSFLDRFKKWSIYNSSKELHIEN